MSQFIIPDFIKNADVNKIHKRMRDNLPNDIDKSEGSDVWNLTYQLHMNTHILHSFVF